MCVRQRFQDNYTIHQSKTSNEMKKIFIAAALFSTIALSSMAFEANINTTTGIDVEVRSSATYTVTVYLIRSHSTARKSGLYNSDNHTITVNGETYQVRNNPLYQQDDKRGAYQYVAGDSLYFNL